MSELDDIIIDLSLEPEPEDSPPPATMSSVPQPASLFERNLEEWRRREAELPTFVEPWEESSVRSGLEGVAFPIGRLQLLDATRGKIVEYRPGQKLDLHILVGLSQQPRFFSVEEVVALARANAPAVIALKVHQGRR